MNLQDLPITKNIVIREGRDNLALHIQVLNPDRTPMDLTGYTAEGSIKKLVSDASPLVSLTFANTLASGIIMASVPPSDAATVLAALGHQGCGVWDVVVTDSLGSRRTWFQGRATASESVTA